MVPPPSFQAHRVAFAVAGSLLLSWCFAPPAGAQDRLEFKNGSAQDGKIVAMSNGSVVIDLPNANGSARMTYSAGLLARVNMAAPPAFQSGLAAYQAGHWDRALADLKSVADQFHGLPTDWAQQAATLLGEVYIEKKDYAKAEAAFNDCREWYPDTPLARLQAAVGEARIALERNDAARAKPPLQPIAQAALQAPALVSAAEGAAYGQAFYVLGRLADQAHDYPEALADYLRTVTVFYQDAAVAADAEASAEALRKAHPGVTVP